MEKSKLLTDILRSVSRSFYLTLRILPANVREPISVAYLLARAADTIADTDAVAVEKRLYYLKLFQKQVMDMPNELALQEIVNNLSDQQANKDEQYLLKSIYQVCMLIYGLWPEDQARVKTVFATLIQGMEIDLTYFSASGEGSVKAFKTKFELDNYIYHVAGCVGGFWTEVVMAHEPALYDWNKKHNINLGINFGKALQLTNILRDLPNDLRIGRCYLPNSELMLLGLKPEELFESENSKQARPLLIAWLQVAINYYGDAEQYFVTTPRHCLRLRLSVLWPILIGLATLGEVSRNEQWLDSESTVKVSRHWVYGMLLCSMPLSFSNHLMRLWMKWLRAKIVVV
ncbi:MAG: squalene/phytoene synthase family protein [Gammaproteobacteria bacterium]|nr:squalene/phytoene synthase family protein [Gammaproteobacteria bacterium]